MKKLIITAILMMAASLSLADYHYAGHEGTNQYPYTSWETAADSIQNAVDASSPHDTVYIGAGEWIEEVVCEFYDSVAIIGMGWDSTYWHTDVYRTEALQLGDACSVEQIKFEHSDWRPVRARSGGPSVVVHNCKFVNSLEALELNGGISEVSHCLFDSCGDAVGILDYSGYFIISNNIILNTTGSWALLIQSDSGLIENNIIISGFNTGIEADGAIVRNNVVIDGDHGIGAFGTQYNNTIIEQGMVGFMGYDSLFNNSISQTRYGIYSDGDCYIAYNNFWNNTEDVAGDELDSTVNIFCDPMFVSGIDVHLQAFSPLIDAGHPDWLDIDGSRSDIGAYGGPYGEIYEYPDLSPAVPDSLTGRFIADTVSITWAYNTEADFSHYQLHKDTISNFEPSIFNQISEPETSFYIDTDVDREHSYYYRIAAIDYQENLSDYSEELEVVPTGIGDYPGASLPQITLIQTNYPNPFNTTTTIVYSVANLGPIPAEIEINIYDIAGRKIKTLIRERRDLGEHSIIWDGKDDNGDDCSTGVYFAKISQWGLEISGKPRKLVLIK